MSTRYNPFFYHEALSCYPRPERIRDVSLLEIGPGRGDFLFALAQRYPDQEIAAIEIKKKRFYKLVRRVQERNLKNVSLILGDARVALPCLFSRNQLKALYMLFLDPWPKKRHAKHRLFQTYFIYDLYRVLKTSGEVTLAHDNASYLRDSCELFLEHSGFRKGDPAGRPDVFDTFYAEKWRAAGRELDAATFHKRALPCLQELKLAYQNKRLKTLWWQRKVRAINFE